MGHLSHLLPEMRIDGIVLTAAGTDTLVYDEQTHALHTLNHTVAMVWQACVGSQTVESLAATTGLSRETVQQALVQLADANLLAGTLPAVARPAQSRRSFMKKAAVGMGVPLIVSVTASTAASAASEDCGRSCTPFIAECFDWSDPFTCSICLPFSQVCGPVPEGLASARMSMSAETVIAIEHELWGE